jgi:hypothetical protein
MPSISFRPTLVARAAKSLARAAERQRWTLKSGGNMRLFTIGLVLCALLVVNSATAAEVPLQIDLTGSWTFTWDEDSKNTNPADLKHEAGVITGIYLNDAKEKCPLVGRIISSTPTTGITLTITCPNWDIKCDGSFENPQSVTGKYVAYGSASGTFQMMRNSPKIDPPKPK